MVRNPFTNKSKVAAALGAALILIVVSIFYASKAPNSNITANQVATPLQGPNEIPSSQEADSIDQAVAIEAGSHGVPAGTQVTTTIKQYVGGEARGHVTFSNHSPAQDFTATKRSGEWTVHY